MDVNETLRVIRKLVADHRDGTEDSDWVEQMAEHVGALDDWITAGGFLPDGWR